MTDLPAQSVPTLEEPVARPRRLTPEQRAGVRRWWRRRPVNRLLVVIHRWPALILGLLLVIETTSGAILLYNQEYFRATHGSFYHHTASARLVTEAQAIDIVARAHPEFEPAFVSRDHGVIAVGDSSYELLYAVDPGTGKINGSARPDSGIMGFLANVHDCGLACEGYPGYLSGLAEPMWAGGPSFLTDITWGGFILGVLGLLMILLFASGLKIWWPGIKRVAGHFYRVRTGRGRFARDYDLHNVIAAWSMPFILMWGITGAAFEFPGVENAWLAITGGQHVDENAYSFTPDKPAPGAMPITLAQATSVALARVPGDAVYSELASKDVPYYAVSIRTSVGAYAFRNFYGSDVYVYVDAYHPDHVKTVPGKDEPAGNHFYDSYLEATHFGWNVNGWWRLIWLAFGLAPLVLMITGVSTWLYRRGVRRRRRASLS